MTAGLECGNASLLGTPPPRGARPSRRSCRFLGEIRGADIRHGAWCAAWRPNGAPAPVCKHGGARVVRGLAHGTRAHPPLLCRELAKRLSHLPKTIGWRGRLSRPPCLTQYLLLATDTFAPSEDSQSRSALVSRSCQRGSSWSIRGGLAEAAKAAPSLCTGQLQRPAQG